MSLSRRWGSPKQKLEKTHILGINIILIWHMTANYIRVRNTGIKDSTFSETQHCSSPIHHRVRSTALYADASSFVCPSNATPYDDRGGHLISVNTPLAALLLPQFELSKFSGDLLNCLTFLQTFNIRVASPTRSRWRLRGLAVACWTTAHYHRCSNLGVGISKGCFIFDFTALPSEVARPI